MKLLYTILLLLSYFILKAQSNAFTVSMAGIGDIKLGMKKGDFEKLINQTVKLPHLTTNNDESYQDTVHVSYKGLEADVIFQKEYSDENKFNIVVWGVRSNALQLKTKSGIGIGDDKIKIVTTYPDFTIWLMPEYEKDYTVKSKTKSTVWLHGDSGNVIVFYLENGKITGMSVTYDEGC